MGNTSGLSAGQNGKWQMAQKTHPKSGALLRNAFGIRPWLIPEIPLVPFDLMFSQ
jgi:hypothetical protein